MNENNKILTGDLCLSYGSTKILHNINMVFPCNSVTALIGPSGSGKSTFLKCLNRMNDGDFNLKVTGRVELDGCNIYSNDIDIFSLRARVGMVFQKPNPFMKSIYDNVLYGPRIHGMGSGRKLHSIAIRSLKQAGLYDEVKSRMHDHAYDLSGGQQQRLCIARALAVNPELILMDEPCSALDPVSASKIDDLILELRKNYTIIIVTHSMRQAIKVSDFVAFFDKGSLIEYGTTAYIFGSDVGVRTQEYIKSGLK